MMYLGDIAEDAVVSAWFSSNDSDGASITLATDGTIKVERDDGTDCTGTSVAWSEDDPATGIHRVTVDTSDNANFAPAHDYLIYIDGAVIDGQTVNAGIAQFSIENRGVNVAKISGDGTAADNLEAMLDGTGATLTLDKLRIDANDANGAVDIDNAGGDAINLAAGNNGSGIMATGDGPGAGLYAQGGATGTGLVALGGGTSGNGIYAAAQVDGHGIAAVGVAAGNAGLSATGALGIIGAGTGGPGMDLDGTDSGLNCQASAGDGIQAISNGGNGHGMYLAGNLISEGLHAVGGATGDGIRATGGATSGHGIYALAQLVGSGLYLYGGITSGDGLYTQARGGNDAGIWSRGEGTGADIDGDISGGVTSVANGVTLADDAITNAKFDELTAWPLTAADTGATAVARTGADGDTLETLSDQLDGVSTLTAANIRTAVGLAAANLDTQLADLPTNAELATALTGMSTLDAAGVRTAVGLGAANLDTQLADLPTVAEFNARTLLASAYFDPAADTVVSVTTVGSVTNGVTLANDAITAAKFDETTAFPVAAADTGATQIARVGADGDTLETLSDQIDGVAPPTAAAVADAVWDELQAAHTTAGSFGLYLDSKVSLGGGAAVTVLPLNSTVQLQTFSVAGGTVQRLTMAKGSSTTLQYAVTDSDGAVVNITGKTLRWVAYDDDLTVIFNHTTAVGGGITITDGANGQFQVAISTTDTATAQTINYAVWNVTDADLYAQGALVISDLVGPTET